VNNWTCSAAGSDNVRANVRIFLWLFTKLCVCTKVRKVPTFTKDRGFIRTKFGINMDLLFAANIIISKQTADYVIIASQVPS